MQDPERRRSIHSLWPRVRDSGIAPALVLAALLGAGCTLTQKMSWISSENPFAQDAASPERGRLVYRAECTSCHGSEGLGDGSAGQVLAVRPTDLQAYARRVEQGLFAAQVAYGKDKNPDMPQFAERLSANEIWDVTSFVYALASKNRIPD